MAGIHSAPAGALVISKMLSGISDASIKGDLALRRVGVDEVGLGANNVNDDVVVYVLLELEKPLDGTFVRGGGEGSRRGIFLTTSALR